MARRAEVPGPAEGPGPADVEVREAATIILVRDSDGGPEVSLLRRNPTAVFAGGAHVFPGGAVDDLDRELDGHPICGIRSDLVASRALGVDCGGLAYWVAAVRECFEEAGVLLARHADGRPLDLTEGAAAERFDAHRRALLSGASTLADICHAESLTLALDAIFYLSHWITPPGAPRRYDTRFFVAAAPPGQTVVPDAEEVVAHLWSTPTTALERHRAGELDLILPTSRSLEVLGRFGATEELLAALAEAEAADVDRGPLLVDDAGGRRRHLPGDPERAAPALGSPACGAGAGGVRS